MPASPALQRGWFAKTNAYTDACAKNNGPILDHLTTVDSARDMESIRQALGEKKINYYGFSYGTYLGQVYATLYPSHLRRVVFDGTVDPRKVWYDANLDQDQAFDDNINIWFGWVAEHDSTYHLGTTEKAVRSLFYRTEEKLVPRPGEGQGRRPRRQRVDRRVPLRRLLPVHLDRPRGRRSPAFVSNGDVKALEAAYLDASGYDPDTRRRTTATRSTSASSAPTPSPGRQSWKHVGARQLAHLPRRRPFETWANTWYNEPCRHWPAQQHEAELKIDGSKVKSLLMVNETLDAATPYAGSLEVRKRFPRARLIAEPGGTTHAGSLFGNACVDDRIAAYLATGDLPRRKSGKRADVTCQPLPRPEPEASSKKTAKAKQAAQTAARAGSPELSALRRAALPR